MNINFFSQKTDPFSHLDSVTQNIAATNFRGRWCTLEFQPDVFVPQCFTVGVVAQGANERLHYNLLADFKKFECVYSTPLAKKLAAEMLRHAEEVLRLAAQQRIQIEDVEFGSANLRLSVPAHTSGESADAIVERLYKDIVVFEPETTTKTRLFQSLDTPSVRKLVNEALKRISGNDFENIVIDANGVLISDGAQTHSLDVNLKTRNACGSVISAVYKTFNIVEMNLLRANLDLNTFAKLQNIEEKGVFLMLPEKSLLPLVEWQRIDDIVGEQSWKLEKDGFRVVSMETPIALAAEIYEWAKPTL